MNATELISIKRTELERKADRLRAELDGVEDELRRWDVTAATIARFKLVLDVDTAVPRSQSVEIVFTMLDGESGEGKTPKEVYAALLAESITTVSLENVRTILSRNRDHLMVSGGRYWRRTAAVGEASDKEVRAAC